MAQPSSEKNKANSPPKVRLTFRAGVVGHRPNRLKREDVASLSARLGEVLDAIKQSVEAFAQANPGLFAAKPACLRAISPLAEGTDRYFAKEALKRDYQLCCPLPFQKEEFENDFKPPNTLEPDFDSVADFNSILKEAAGARGLTTFELDGARDHAPEAYAAAGRVVLNQSDLLIVVWDGDPEVKRGGTYETLIGAIKFAVPVLWIDAWAPHHWQLLQLETDLPAFGTERCTPKPNEGLQTKLNEVVRHVLSAPEPDPKQPHQEHPPDLRKKYFAEEKPEWNRFFGWKLFRDLFASFKIGIPRLRVADFEQAVAHDWPEDTGSEVERWVNHQLRPHYAWSDKLADLYADKYRSSFVAAYVLGATAVILALFSYVLKNTRFVSWAMPVGELLVIARILWLVHRGNKHMWHQRWMDYRLVAELVRQLRFLIPLGGARPFPRLPPHLGFGNPINSWMYWHLRAIDRAVGLPKAEITQVYLSECISYIRQVIVGQNTFHQVTATRSETIEHRLHLTGFVLFVLAAVAVAAGLLVEFGLDWDIPRLHDILLFFAAGFPAVGAALAAISNQAEFARIAKRSHAMAGRLQQEVDKLDKYSATVRSGQVAEDALRVAQTMVDEVLDWRLVFLDRPLVTPG